MQEDKKVKSVSKHAVSIDRRETVNISGVLDVISFDEEAVIAETELGVIVLRGLNLHVNRLSLDVGELSVDGEINSLTYEDRNTYGKGGSIWGKLFK